MKKGAIINKKNFIKSIYPYLLSGCILTGGFKLSTGHLPFYVDKDKLNREIDINYENDITYLLNKDYIDKDSILPNKLSIYESWNEKEDGSYYRYVNVYDLTGVSQDDYLNLINGDKEILSGIENSKITHLETSSTKPESLTKYKAIFRFVSENDYIYVKESSFQNVMETLDFLKLLLSTTALIFLIRSNNIALNENNKDIMKKILK